MIIWVVEGVVVKTKTEFSSIAFLTTTLLLVSKKMFIISHRQQQSSVNQTLLFIAELAYKIIVLEGKTRSVFDAIYTD